MNLIKLTGTTIITVKDSAIFSNLIGYKKMMRSIEPGKKVTFNFAEAKIVDHSFLEALSHFEEEYTYRRRCGRSGI